MTRPVPMDLDPTLAYTALMTHDPQFAKRTVDQGVLVRQQLLRDFYAQAEYVTLMNFTRVWVAARDSGTVPPPAGEDTTVEDRTQKPIIIYETRPDGTRNTDRSLRVTPPADGDEPWLGAVCDAEGIALGSLWISPGDMAALVLEVTARQVAGKGAK